MILINTFHRLDIKKAYPILKNYFLVNIDPEWHFDFRYHYSESSEGDYTPSIRVAIVMALAHFEENQDFLLEVLEKALYDPNDEVVLAVLHTLERMDGVKPTKLLRMIADEEIKNYDHNGYKLPAIAREIIRKKEKK